MKRAAYKVFLACIAGALLHLGLVAGVAQNREKFVISAKAGGINAVTGRAMMRARGSSNPEQLTIKEDLEAGDVVTTDADGRVEMLLNPGSYLRVGENSEFELADNSLENLEIRLLRGTAIVEATGADDTEMLINITTPHAKLAIVRRGLYRVNVIPGDTTELIVRKGRVMLSDSHTKVKGGNKVVFSGSSFFMAKLEKADKKAFDNLDAWSKGRAETLAQANRKMSGRDVGLLLSSLGNDWSRISPGATGLWLFNRRFGCFTFFPFNVGWGSPYGSWYSNGFYDGYCCGRRYGLLNTGAGGGASAASSGSAGSGGRVVRGPSAPPPAAPREMSAPMGGIPRAAAGKIGRVNDPQP